VNILWFSGLCHRVVWQGGTMLSVEHTALVSRLDDGDGAFLYTTLVPT